jgi:hypothetical protein
MARFAALYFGRRTPGPARLPDTQAVRPAGSVLYVAKRKRPGIARAFVFLEALFGQRLSTA